MVPVSVFARAGSCLFLLRVNNENCPKNGILKGISRRHVLTRICMHRFLWIRSIYHKRRLFILYVLRNNEVYVYASWPTYLYKMQVSGKLVNRDIIRYSINTELEVYCLLHHAWFIRTPFTAMLYNVN